VVSTRYPTLARLLERKLLAAYVRSRVGKLQDDLGLPWARSINHRYIQRSFWGPDDYQAVIRGYVARSRSNLSVAARLAQEAERVHGVRLEVPQLLEQRAQ
jgi:hypothetical protein